MERRASHRRAAAEHQPDVPVPAAMCRRTTARHKPGLCVECGFEENADVVGAINVLRAGHARLACEVSGAVMPPAAGTHRSDSLNPARCRGERRRNPPFDNL
jgi:hypothetical protein